MLLDPKTVLLYPAGHVAQEWQVRVPAHVSFARIFEPSLWVDVEKLMRHRGGKRPAKDDLLRVISADRSFDVTCTIIAADAGYTLEYRHGRRPSPVVQVLEDLDALPAIDTSEVKGRADILRRRWRAIGVVAEDIQAARRRFAKAHHPDVGGADGRRLATVNAIVDRAIENLPEAA